MVRFRCKPCPGRVTLREKVLSGPFGRDPLSRRVWGQRPGQPGGSPFPTADRPAPGYARRGRGAGMDLVMKGRGIRITDQVRRTAEHKLAKIGRLDPKVL